MTANGFDLELPKLHVAQAKQKFPGPSYYFSLQWIHRILKPKTYLEIGVDNGNSLRAALPETICLGIDPTPRIMGDLGPNVRIFPMTSNEFFDRHDLRSLLDQDHFNVAFIDGLHIFEQVLLDFINLERHAGSNSVAILHDCLPLDEVTSARTRTTEFYSGDVWKTILCLKEMRPELQLAMIPAFPTGLCIVTGLNKYSDILQRSYRQCVERYIGLTFRDYERHSSMAPRIRNTKVAVEQYLLARAADRQVLHPGR